MDILITLEQSIICNLLDKRDYPKWIQELKHTTSPMKHMQIQAAKTLLGSVQTTSYNRML